jgi:hypothetical protein
MNSFITNLKIELAKSNKEKREIEIKIKRCFVELSNYINPFFKSAKDIKADEIEQIGDDLQSLKLVLEKLENRIIELEDELGE